MTKEAWRGKITTVPGSRFDCKSFCFQFDSNEYTLKKDQPFVAASRSADRRQEERSGGGGGG